MTNTGITMRKIIIPNGITYEENQNFPLWLAIKEIPSTTQGLISVLLINAMTHKEAVQKAEEIGLQGEIFYISSIWNLFERLEDMIENETG